MQRLGVGLGRANQLMAPGEWTSWGHVHPDSSGKPVKVKMEDAQEGQICHDFDNYMLEPRIDVESTEPDQQLDVVHEVASETSSSFGYVSSDWDTDSDGGNAKHQAEMGVQDGRARNVAIEDKEDEHGESHARSRKGLNAEWKEARRGIEWRCQWLALRVKELQMRANKYDRILEYIKPNSLAKSEAEPHAARFTPVRQGMQGRKMFRRKNRKKVEVGSQLENHFSRHPVFSRYGSDGDSKTKKRASETVAVAEELRQEESDLEERERSLAGETGAGGQDSMEQLLWKVDLLQKRVGILKECLLMGSPADKGLLEPCHVFGGPQRFPASLAQGTSAVLTPSPKPSGSSSSYCRRRAADYDIDNIVMPVNVGAKFVEIVKPAHIETPLWRIADESCAPGEQESSSEEATDDETFAKRHAYMEITERQQRNLPPDSKRLPDSKPVKSGGSLEKFRGAETGPCEVKQEPQEEESALWSPEFVPRKKRSRGVRVDPLP